MGAFPSPRKANVVWAGVDGRRRAARGGRGGRRSGGASDSASPREAAGLHRSRDGGPLERARRRRARGAGRVRWPRASARSTVDEVHVYESRLGGEGSTYVLRSRAALASQLTTHMENDTWRRPRPRRARRRRKRPRRRTGDRGAPSRRRDPAREKAIDVAVSTIEKQFGKGSIMRLGEGMAPARGQGGARPGSLGLDIALGVGGLPRGRVVEIYGPESSGKTTLALHVVARGAEAGRHLRVRRRRARAGRRLRAQAGRAHRRPAGLAAGLRRAGAGDHRDAGALGRRRRHRRRLGGGADAARRARGRDGRRARRPAGAPDEPGAAQADRARSRSRTRWSSSSTRSA